MSTNILLGRLCESDFARLTKGGAIVDLPMRTVLQQKNTPVKVVYFLTSGLASVLIGADDAIEAALFGREGMAGVTAILDPDFRVRHQTIIQTAGAGWRIPVESVLEAVEASPAIRRELLRYACAVLTQTAETARANGRAKLNNRLARWLLMAQDRVESDQINLTHEFLSIMLGVRRAGVTTAMQQLAADGLIRTGRSCCKVLNRQGLEKLAGKYYLPDPMLGQPRQTPPGSVS